jgi:hypothetical protein
MKKLYITLFFIAVITLLLLCTTKSVPSGKYCIDVANDATRVEEAYGSILGLGHPATTVEIESAIFNWVEGSTHDYERRKTMTQFTPPPFNSAKNYKPAPTTTPKKK